jgi:hypothetical protein
MKSLDALSLLLAAAVGAVTLWALDNFYGGRIRPPKSEAEPEAQPQRTRSITKELFPTDP